MTDKQIIDGIDVSGCECFIEKMDFPNNLKGGYYNQNNLCECGVQGVESYPFFCKDNPNCYYKQLKEKEKECEELEKLYKELQDDMLACNKCRATIKLQQQLDQLKKTNEELKNIIKSLQNK